MKAKEYKIPRLLSIHKLERQGKISTLPEDTLNMMQSHQQKKSEYYTYLPQGYIPNNTDILCGSGKANAKHHGNIIFMRLIRSSRKDYADAGSRFAKTVIVTSVVSDIIDSGMRFLKADTNYNRYVELSSDSAHAKVGNSIRHLLKQQENTKNNSTTGVKSKSSRLGASRPAIVANMVHSIGDTFVGSRNEPNQQQASTKTTMFGLSEQALAFDETEDETSTENLQAVLSALSSSENVIFSSSSGDKGSEHDLLANAADEDIFSTDPLDDRDATANSIHQKPRQANCVAGVCPLPLDSKLDFKNLDVDELSDVLGTGRMYLEEDIS
jgi:hypothetical protein